MSESPHTGDNEQPQVGTVVIDGRRYAVFVRVAHDGIEYVGRLWFADEAWDDDEGVPDRGALPGRTAGEVVARAEALDDEELTKRYRRALAEKRRYKGLRQTTEAVLARIRHLNQVAISMRAGLLDVEGAAQEIGRTEQELHALVDRLRQHAGVEDR